jgi:hypothetical protein
MSFSRSHEGDKIAAALVLSSPDDKERGPDRSPPSPDDPAIGAIIIPGEIWPSVGTNSPANAFLRSIHNLIECCRVTV